MLQAWVKGALERGRIGQAELARKLTDQLGRSIDRAAVNKMANGGRDLSADEMLAIADLTGEPIPNAKMQSVPLVSWISAGGLANSDSQVPDDEKRRLTFSDLGQGDFFALTVVGDSMNRVSPEDSIIIVNRADKELLPGRCYVFIIRGEATYKRWEPDPARLEPWSTNDIHKPHYVKSKKDFDVLGRVRRTVLDL